MSQSIGKLRRDLTSDVTEVSGRGTRVIVDEIAGRIARVPDRLWQAFTNGDASEGQWRQAAASGWTRERLKTRPANFSPLYFRTDIGSIDAFACRLAPISGIVFSPFAVTFWVATFVITSIMLMSRIGQLSISLASLQSFFQQASPVALASWFVVTKAAHELAHAVVCRRVGSRCGVVGILLLCGVPCPFCDVSDVARQPSRWSRAAVMLAGIYVEWIIATVAAIVWMNSTDAGVQLHAMNLMIVCGISTLVFNANPLMRYDGYFVLSDWINSFNLRREASDAFDRMIVSPLAGANYPRCELDRTTPMTIGLAFYHVASLIYRCFVSIALAAMLMMIADRFYLRSLTVVVVAVMLMFTVVRSGKRILGIVRGKQDWSRVPAWRRMTITGFTTVVVLTIGFLPTPRYRSSEGIVDAVSATKVFLPSDSVIESVDADFGDLVQAGQTLLSVRDDVATIDHVKLRGQLRVARVRSQWSRQDTIGRGDFAHQWATHRAVEDALQTQLASVQRRIERADVRSPATGIVLPAEAISVTKLLTMTTLLSERTGTLGTIDKAWCRISADGQVWASFHFDANDREVIKVGSLVRISLPFQHHRVVDSVVQSVSPINKDDASVLRRAGYQVLCPLPAVEADTLLSVVGSQCHGVVQLPWRCLADDGWLWLGEWMGG